MPAITRRRPGRPAQPIERAALIAIAVHRAILVRRSRLLSLVVVVVVGACGGPAADAIATPGHPPAAAPYADGAILERAPCRMLASPDDLPAALATHYDRDMRPLARLPAQ